MIKAGFWLLPVWLALVASVTLAQQTTLPSDDAGNHYAEYKSFKAVHEAAVDALNRSKQCEQALNAYKSVNDTPIGHFIAAKFLWLMGRPREAIATLEAIRARHGDEAEPKEFGTGMKTGVVCDCWIASIARQCGDTMLAKKAYHDVIIRLRGNPEADVTKRIVLLYLSELEFRACDHPEQAIATLREAQTKVAIDNKHREASETVQHWAVFQELTIQGKVKDADASLKPLGSQNVEMIVFDILTFMGIMVEPRGGMYEESGQILFDKDVALVMESRTTDIDRMLILMATANRHRQRNDYATAAKLYAEVFDGHTFFSPDAGLMLAECQKKNEQAVEGNATLRKVRERFPLYADIAERQKQQR